jgi:hypothetical protein
MSADADLPVWTIKPNWVNGITERLEWLTDIQASTFGVEQAIAYRLSPRRSFETTFNPVGDVRSYFDLWLHRFGEFEFMLPLWHDAGKLTAGIAPAAVTIPVDTTYREYEVGGMALLVGDTPHDFDKVEITAVGPASLTVAAGGITRAWPKGSVVHPLRRSRLAQDSQVSALTSRVGQATILFELNQANDIADEGDWDGLEYLGLPVLTTTPNYREAVDMSFLRNSVLLDNDTGLREIDDEAGRAFTLQLHSFMFSGRADHWAFRQFLYRLNGRQSAIWVPTFNQDFRLAAARLATDHYLDIGKIGYDYSGGVITGRNHVLIARTSPAEIVDVLVAPDPATQERLGLGGAIGAAYAAGTTGSFIDTCRMSSDTVEITHHTDTDGVGECKIGFQSFLNERISDDDEGPISVPLDAGSLRTVECGSPPAVHVSRYWQTTGTGKLGGNARLTWPEGDVNEGQIILGFIVYSDPHDSWLEPYTFTWPAGWELLATAVFAQSIIEFRWYRATGTETLTDYIVVHQDHGAYDGHRSQDGATFNLGTWAAAGSPFQDAQISFNTGDVTDGAEATATTGSTAYSFTVLTTTTPYLASSNFSDPINDWSEETEILCGLGMGAGVAISSKIASLGVIEGENRQYTSAGTWFNLNAVMRA